MVFEDAQNAICHVIEVSEDAGAERVRAEVFGGAGETGEAHAVHHSSSSAKRKNTNVADMRVTGRGAAVDTCSTPRRGT